MNASEKRELAELAVTLARHLPDSSACSAADLANRLARLSRAYHRHAERECSDEWYCNGAPGCSEEQTPANRQQRILDARLAKVASDLPEGWKVETAGDPRGGWFVLVTADGRRLHP